MLKWEMLWGFKFGAIKKKQTVYSSYCVETGRKLNMIIRWIPSQPLNLLNLNM